MTTGLPQISVLVLDRNRPGGIKACLSSLAAQTYPKGRFGVDVVHAQTQTFCASCNAAVRASKADFVALIGGEVRVDPNWLAELVSAAERHQASVAGSRILNLAGDQIEFAGDSLSFVGHLSGPSIAAAAGAHLWEDRRLLFSCGDSALFRRAAFLDAGGFDEAFVVGLEDVDLGWRLNVLGHTVVLASRAIAYRAPVQSSPAALVRRRRLLERNALAMIYKNYEAGTLERVFPVAVALSLARGLIRSGIDGLTLPVSAEPAAATVEIRPDLVAHLIALEDFGSQLPALRRKRQQIQQQRRRSDAELWGLFGEPLSLHGIDGPLAEIADVLIAEFGIRELIAAPGRTRGQRTGVEAAVPANARSERAAAPPQTPKVSIIILTALGATHIGECLASLRQQSYPADRIEVVVVDNNSANDPTPEVQRAYPGARVIRNASNLGFAAGNNIGAAAASGDYLIFLNDDTRVHPDWLIELVGAAHSGSAAAVASCILDWSGTRIDFVDGAVNFQGKGFQLNYGVPIDSLALKEKPLLFACGCAMLVDRAVFMDAGRWDEGTFAYYEDVELGWRLNLLGHAVWFAPRAIVYHKHHGTSSQWPEPPRLRLYERNSLRMLYALLEPATLQRVLPAALLLAADRALLTTTLSRATEEAAERNLQAAWRRLAPRYLIALAKVAFVKRGVNRRTPIPEAVRRLGIRGFAGVARDMFLPYREAHAPGRRAAYLVEGGKRQANSQDLTCEIVPIEVAAMLAGIYSFLADLPALARRRSDVQQRRRATDLEIVSRFGSHWCQVAPAHFQLHHAARQAILIEEFALATVGPADRMGAAPIVGAPVAG